MNFLPLLFFGLTGAALWLNQGHYVTFAGVYTILFLGVTAIMLLHGWFRSLSSRAVSVGAAFCLVLFCFLLSQSPVILYPLRGSDTLTTLHELNGLAWALSFFILATSFFEGKKWDLVFKTSVALLAIIFIVGLCLVPVISPRPFIDVWVNNTRAIDHFLNGENPYSQIYPDIYRGRYDYKPGFLYFPGILFWLAPFRYLFGDIRYGFIFADILIASGLFKIARKLRAPEKLAWIAPLLWLSMPVSYFVLEQSWIDTALAAAAVLTFWALESEYWIVVGVLSGLAFSLKQYGFLIGFFALIQAYLRTSVKNATKMAVAAVITSLALIVPFAAIDWDHFIESTVTSQTSAQVRADAFNATSYFIRQFRWVMPQELSAALSVLAIGAAAWILFRNKRAGTADSAAALYLSFGVAFLFGKFAFCNYHYLLESFLLLYLVSCSGETAKPEIAEGRLRAQDLSGVS